MTMLRGIFAGWHIALMVWPLPASEGTRLHIVIIGGVTLVAALNFAQVASRGE